MAFCLIASPLYAAVFNPVHETLPNGMEVLVIPIHRAPIVTHQIWYKVGAAEDPAGFSGTAHFLEHLMFRGTKTVPPGEFSNRVAFQGGNENAFTSWDYTGYYQNVAADRLEMMMRLEADRMRNLVLDEKLLASEREVILEERHQVVGSKPDSELVENMRATLFARQPYGTPILGWEHEIRGLTRENQQEFYRTWYAPNNAIMVVAGDVDPKNVIALANRYFGRIPPAEIPPRQNLQEPALRGERRIIMHDKRVQQASWIKLTLAPGLLSDAQHRTNLSLAIDAIAGGATSPLYKSLVIDQKIATSAGMYYDDSLRHAGLITAWLTPAAGVSVDTAEAAFNTALKTLLASGIASPDLERARQQSIDSVIFAGDSLFGPARMFGAALASGAPLSEIEEWPDRVKKVTLNDATAALRTAFNPENAVTGILLPLGKTPADILNPSTMPSNLPPATPPDIQGQSR